jgi:hypothetical protein
MTCLAELVMKGSPVRVRVSALLRMAPRERGFFVVLEIVERLAAL